MSPSIIAAIEAAPRFTAEEEGRLLAAGKVEKIVESNLRCVLFEARKHGKGCVTIDDCFSVGAEAMMTAARKWRYQGKPFANFAKRYVTEAIFDLIHAERELVNRTAEEEELDYARPPEPGPLDTATRELVEELLRERLSPERAKVTRLVVIEQLTPEEAAKVAGYDTRTIIGMARNGMAALAAEKKKGRFLSDKKRGRPQKKARQRRSVRMSDDLWTRWGQRAFQAGLSREELLERTLA